MFVTLDRLIGALFAAAAILGLYLVYIGARKGGPAAIAKATDWWATAKAWWSKGKAELENAKSRLAALEGDVAAIKQKMGL